LIPDIPASEYFESVQNKPKIRATRYKDCETIATNIVSSHELDNITVNDLTTESVILLSQS